MAIDRSGTLLPEFGQRSVRYRPLPLFELLGIDQGYLERPITEKAVILLGYILPPIELTDHELQISRELQPSLMLSDSGARFMQRFSGVNEAGCWIQPLGEPSESCKRPGNRYPKIGGIETQRLSRHYFYGDLRPGGEAFQDHLCSNPECANPRHIEPVSPSVNTRRANHRLNAEQMTLAGTVFSWTPQYVPFYRLRDDGLEQYLHDDGLD